MQKINLVRLAQLLRSFAYTQTSYKFKNETFDALEEQCKLAVLQI